MSCPNFHVQRNFPLFLYDDSNMDWIEAQDFFDAVQDDLDALNGGLSFFRVSLESGHYCGVQFFVEMDRYAEEAGFDVDGFDAATNEDCRYYLDMCRSEAIRKYSAERRKVARLMALVAEKWGFEEYYCTAIFSNGEAIYEKATPRTRMASAARGLASA